MELTDYQIKLLKIVDEYRWGEADKLDAYKYHLVRRALGEKDPVITFEMEMAARFVSFWGNNPPRSPKPGPLRSPWIKTWDVPFWRTQLIETDSPDVTRWMDLNHGFHGPVAPDSTP